jgi:hypothetical protein
LIRVEVPYADTRPDDLSFALGLPLHELAVGGLRLRLLGASHQVAWAGGVETVACLPGRPPHLPGTSQGGPPGYRFSSSVQPLDRPAAAALWRDLADRPDALVGVFDGDPDAVTALLATPDGWATWHAYPQTGQLVGTRTVLAVSR